MGPKRSIAKVVLAIGCSTRLLERWSSTYHWVARASRYNNYPDKQLREAHERVVFETAVKHAAIARAVHERALLQLSAVDVNSLTLTQLLQLAMASIELEAAVHVALTDDCVRARSTSKKIFGGTKYTSKLLIFQLTIIASAVH